MLNIILEGENCTGKTTIANYLRKELGFKYTKCSQPKKDPYVEYIEKLNKAKYNTVFDRFHLGEFVYGKIYRGKSLLDEQQRTNIEMLALAKNTIIIFCTDTAEKIVERFKVCKEDYAKPKLVNKTLNEFDCQISKTILPYYTHQINSVLDLTRDKFKRLFELVVREEKLYLQNYNQKIIGNTDKPNLLLVGDKRNQNHKKYNNLGQPFDFGLSGKFLFEKLKAVKIPLNELAIVNSDYKKLKKAYIEINPKVVIALGKNASSKLSESLIPHITLNHPQFENRFRHHEDGFQTQLRKSYDYSRQL